MDPRNNNKDPMTTLDRVNLTLGVIAIVLLGGSLVAARAPEGAHVPQMLVQGLQWAGYLAMAGYLLTLAALKRVEIASFSSHRHTRSGANSTVQAVALIAILVAINWFGARYHSRADLTQNKQYSLSEQSRKIVANLKEAVAVDLFVKNADPYSENLKTLWGQYRDVNPDKLKLNVLDIDKNPGLARQNKVTAYGTSMLKRGDRTTTITGSQEQDLSSALLKVTQNGQKVIYFLTGHGEAGLATFDKNGLSQAKDALTKQNYKLDTISLLGKDPKVPADAAELVIAGPTKPLLPAEIKAIEDYLAAGGHAFISVQPQSTSNVAEIATAYGITVHNDLVIDPRQNAGDLAAPVVQKFTPQTITNGLQVAFFPGSRSVTKAEKPPAGVNVSILAETSADAWGATNLMERPLAYHAGRDTKGPVGLVALAEKGKTKLVVAGNSAFYSNAAFQQFSNGDLFLNAANYMAGEENLVSIPPKDSAPKTVDLLPGQSQGIFWGTVVILPLGLLLAGAFAFWKRR